jgi:hypothetical protein
MGRPRKDLTDEQVEQVEKLAAVLPQEQIADYLAITDRTLRQRIADDPRVSSAYKRGRAKAAEKIGSSLIQKALNGDTASMIFYLKTQCGWKETERHEHTGEDGGPLRFTVIEDYSGAGDGEADEG